MAGRVWAVECWFDLVGSCCLCCLLASAGYNALLVYVFEELPGYYYSESSTSLCPSPSPGSAFSVASCRHRCSIIIIIIIASTSSCSPLSRFTPPAATLVVGKIYTFVLVEICKTRV